MRAVDYPPLCADAGRLIATGACDWGVLGGSGQGEKQGGGRRWSTFGLNSGATPPARSSTLSPIQLQRRRRRSALSKALWRR